MPLPKSNNYTIEDIYALPDGQRAELIDGQMYFMSMPETIHQRLVLELCCAIGNYIDKNHLTDKVCLSPFAVFINNDERNYVEPDLFIVCDPSKINSKGCNGAPDFVIEIVSPSSQRMDYLTKLFKYRTAGVREYWIVNPMKETVQTYLFGDIEDFNQYSFDDEIPVGIYDDLKICIADLLK
nr:Uma2 family endonuclease [uncultured Mediterraneibacter sp.]